MKNTTATVCPSNESRIYKRRIGSTTYRVGVHFSATARESFDDKVIRMIRNDSSGRKAVKRSEKC